VTISERRIADAVFALTEPGTGARELLDRRFTV
jgi:hypothetical protein